jgi:hypothetical protein
VSFHGRGLIPHRGHGPPHPPDRCISNHDCPAPNPHPNGQPVPASLGTDRLCGPANSWAAGSGMPTWPVKFGLRSLVGSARAPHRPDTAPGGVSRASRERRCIPCIPRAEVGPARNRSRASLPPGLAHRGDQSCGNGPAFMGRPARILPSARAATKRHACSTVDLFPRSAGTHGMVQQQHFESSTTRSISCAPDPPPSQSDATSCVTGRSYDLWRIRKVSCRMKPPLR